MTTRCCASGLWPLASDASDASDLWPLTPVAGMLRLHLMTRDSTKS